MDSPEGHDRNVLHPKIATDENGRDFGALTLHPAPAAEEHVSVWVFIDGENGFGADVPSIINRSLKILPDGKFGA